MVLYLKPIVCEDDSVCRKNTKVYILCCTFRFQTKCGKMTAPHPTEFNPHLQLEIILKLQTSWFPGGQHCSTQNCTDVCNHLQEAGSYALDRNLAWNIILWELQPISIQSNKPSATTFYFLLQCSSKNNISKSCICSGLLSKLSKKRFESLHRCLYAH